MGIKSLPSAYLSDDDERQIRLRIAQEVVLDAAAWRWDAKAAEWEACIHRHGVDYPGRMDATARLERDAEMAQLALAARRKAHLLRQRQVRL